MKGYMPWLLLTLILLARRDTEITHIDNSHIGGGILPFGEDNSDEDAL